jgi:RNA polymerase sigma-70 factor (ECF subfamily)
MSDEVAKSLRAALASGRTEAFAAFYDQHAARMLALALAVCGSRADAEDALQQTFLNLFRYRRAFGRAEDPLGYALTAVRNCALRLRARRGEESLDPSALQIAARPEAAEHEPSPQLQRALARLRPEQSEVLALKLEVGLSFAQIGALLNLSPNTAASRYRHALEHLARDLGGLG